MVQMISKWQIVTHRSRQARSQGEGENRGNFPPIPKVAPIIFRLIKFVMCEPKIIQCKLTKLIKEPILLQLLVEPDQSSKLGLPIVHG